jgi:hypothetical protein
MPITRLSMLFLAVVAVNFTCTFCGFAADPAPAPAPPLEQARPMIPQPLGQWQIYRVEVSSAAISKTPDQKNAFYTILLDSATGETWLLSPTDKDGAHHFVWVRIEREAKP